VSIRKKKLKDTAFAVRIIRFSLELAEASGRRERFPRQVADVLTKRSGTNESPWFYNRKMRENKSETGGSRRRVNAV